ncbi:hypothetical protein CHS0354_022700 [Potamilus streckersoni]|uniref:Uncharacterized protein n=1 Tax=Potamilus streckersoni TaxID=2493646 RepID=A0AAE0VJM2_9BIVA|nr:hypothetical protein CHS0354_022700 [Potamilus streckersoni]
MIAANKGPWWWLTTKDSCQKGLRAGKCFLKRTPFSSNENEILYLADEGVGVVLRAFPKDWQMPGTDSDNMGNFRSNSPKEDGCGVKHFYRVKIMTV